MMDADLQRLDEKVRQAHHHFLRMKRRYESALAAARDTRFPADRNERLRAEKEFRMALRDLVAAVKQFSEPVIDPARPTKIHRTTKKGRRPGRP
jgi:hypothetical protein